MNESDTDDDWLNLSEYACPSCKTLLVICDHSPFEDGYYFYCTDCIARVDVSIYDAEYDAIEKQLQNETGISMEADDYLDQLFPRIEKQLATCQCGGKFQANAVRRCLSCVTLLPDVPLHQNVWHKGWGTDECEHLHKGIVLEARWLN